MAAAVNGTLFSTDEVDRPGSSMVGSCREGRFHVDFLQRASCRFSRVVTRCGSCKASTGKQVHKVDKLCTARFPCRIRKCWHLRQLKQVTSLASTMHCMGFVSVCECCTFAPGGTQTWMALQPAVQHFRLVPPRQVLCAMADHKVMLPYPTNVPMIRQLCDMRASYV